MFNVYQKFCAVSKPINCITGWTQIISSKNSNCSLPLTSSSSSLLPSSHTLSLPEPDRTQSKPSSHQQPPSPFPWRETHTGGHTGGNDPMTRIIELTAYYAGLTETGTVPGDGGGRAPEPSWAKPGQEMTEVAKLDWHLRQWLCPKWHPIPYIVHRLSKVVHTIWNRMPFGTHPLSGGRDVLAVIAWDP